MARVVNQSGDQSQVREEECEEKWKRVDLKRKLKALADSSYKLIESESRRYSCRGRLLRTCFPRITLFWIPTA